MSERSNKIVSIQNEHVFFLFDAHAVRQHAIGSERPTKCMLGFRNHIPSVAFTIQIRMPQAQTTANKEKEAKCTHRGQLHMVSINVTARPLTLFLRLQ
mgnify:CR=1 FL=1